MHDFAVLENVFLAALGKVPAERAKYLDEACRADAGLKRQVEKMLAAHREAGSFLETPPSALAVDDENNTAVFRHVSEAPGTRIGPYKLLEQIGEGGFGVVYLAEQQRPVKRLVALKIIKPGMDTKEVIARFESERQALAIMDHPNIAKVHDAGTTESGRPYFVMELVRGLAITEYCNRDGLNVEQRLALFIDLCKAVQHAHQKAIIHRDLKPSNVLVRAPDGAPIVKIIDFGVAKALNQELTERTLLTQFSQMIGTPLYMSPEQAALGGLDIDTRSDVYSLGVILYELLTGTTPFDKERLKKVGFDEMRRIIREEEPETVSARLAKTKRSRQTPSAVAVQDGTPTRNAGAPVPPTYELDWIVSKSLEKDRSRRYDSASALAADVQRYLSDEQVLACPPSAAYRFRKFAGKHRATIATASLISVSLLLGTTFSVWQAIRATRAESLAIANERVAQREGDRSQTALQAEASQRRLAEERAEQLRIQTQQLEEQQKRLENNQRINATVIDEVLKSLDSVSGKGSQQHDALLSAIKRLRAFDPKEQVVAYHRLGNILTTVREPLLASLVYKKALELNLGDISAIIDSADALFKAKRYHEAIDFYTTAAAIHPPDSPSNLPLLPVVRRGFAQCRLQRYDEALADFQAACEVFPTEAALMIRQKFERPDTEVSAPRDPQIRERVLSLMERFGADQIAANREHCADFYATWGDFERAKRELELLIASESSTTGPHYKLALIALHSNDLEAYRDICSDMLEQFGSSEDWETNRLTTYVCALNGSPLFDYSPAIELARRAISKSPNAETHSALGMALYRADQLEPAVAALNAALQSKVNVQSSAFIAPYFLAMAHHRLGHSEDSKKWLLAAQPRKADHAARHQKRDPAANWRLKIALELLDREATELITDSQSSETKD